MLGLLLFAAASPLCSAQAKAQLTGAGSTFVYPIMTRWVSSFQQTNPGVQINYQSIGRGGGIRS